MRLIDIDSVFDVPLLVYGDNELARLRAIVRRLESVPAINIQSLRPKARWIDGGEQFGAKPKTFRVCSHSNICLPREDVMVPPPLWQFCPLCGADMRGENDG